MRSIDGINVVRVRKSIAVANASSREAHISITYGIEASDPTLLSSLDKNARLVFYSSIQSTAGKISNNRIKRVRSRASEVSSTEDLNQRMFEILQAESISQTATTLNDHVDPTISTLPLFSYSPKEQKLTDAHTASDSSITESGLLVQQANEIVSKMVYTVADNSYAVRHALNKLAKSIESKVHRIKERI